MLSEILDQPEDAITELSELLKHQPDFLPALAGRAVLSARLGRSQAALADIQRCLKQQLNPQMHYQLACVYALLDNQQQSMADQALHHLAIATTPAYGSQQIMTDKDLSKLRSRPEFHAIVEGIKAARQAMAAD